MAQPFIGEITQFGGHFAPRNWAFCNGQLLPISQHTALFSLLGTTYGGDGRSTFALPNLQGRAVMGEGTGPGLTTRRLGSSGGSPTTTLGVNNMPSHNHQATLHAENAAGTASLPGGQMLSRSGTDTIYVAPTADRSDVAMSAEAIVEQPVGAGTPANNMQPHGSVNYIIALEGLYPSRS